MWACHGSLAVNALRQLWLGQSRRYYFLHELREAFGGTGVDRFGLAPSESCARGPARRSCRCAEVLALRRFVHSRIALLP
jgi:hypothetical protein